MVLGLKTYYGVSATVFVATFAITLGLIEIMKPEWASSPKMKKIEPKKPEEEKSMYYGASGIDKKDLVVNHTFAVIYSLVIALTLSIVYAVAANAMLKGGDKLDSTVNTSLVIVGVFLMAKIFFFFKQPEFIMSMVAKKNAKGEPIKDASGKTVMVAKMDMMKENGVSLAIAIIAGIAAQMMYKKKGAMYIPDTSFGRQHYKMSYPMKH